MYCETRKSLTRISTKGNGLAKIPKTAPYCIAEVRNLSRVSERGIDVTGSARRVRQRVVHYATGCFRHMVPIRLDDVRRRRDGHVPSATGSDHEQSDADPGHHSRRIIAKGQSDRRER